MPASPWVPWPYHEALSLAEAMTELTILARGIYGHPLPPQHGGPVRLVVPWKYGFKSIKSIVRIEITARQPPTLWSTVAPGEYDFTANVKPPSRIPAGPRPRSGYSAAESGAPRFLTMATLPSWRPSTGPRRGASR
jgi:sulfoxide reductase catalytic subunit YedY